MIGPYGLLKRSRACYSKSHHTSVKTRRGCRPSSLRVFLLRAPSSTDVPILLLNHSLSLSRLRPCTVVFCPVCSLIFFVYFKTTNPKDVEEASVGKPSQNQDESPTVRQVFSLFKTYLETKLEQNGKQFERKSKLEK